MANAPESKSTGNPGGVRLVCSNCGKESVASSFKAGDIAFCDACDGSLVPAPAKKGKTKTRSRKKKRKHSTRLICTNCGAAASIAKYDSGDILFCEKCHGSMTPAESAPKPRERDFGKYRIRGEIGRGGMGVVYRAEHTSLKTDVALKVLTAEGGADTEGVKLLFREAQSASKLRHPNIVTVHDVDEVDGEYYIAMEYIDGQGMDELLRKKPLKPKKAARLVQEVASAIQYAHEKGIIHRDIKPSNILVEKAGKPFVMDFGIARDVRSDGEKARAGTVMGTPGYMSPEQARGEQDIDRRSDVYSLGALLHYALTGHPPYEGDNTTETLQNVLEADELIPEDLPRTVPPDLAAICLKALARDKETRYKSAKLLTEDLMRFQRGDAVLAAPSSPLDMAIRLLKRYKLFVAMGAGFAVILVVVLAVALSAQGPSEKELAAQRRKAKMEKAAREAKEEEERQEKDRLKARLAEEEFKNTKARIIDKVDGIKKMSRTRFEALEKTFNQNPNDTLAALDEVEGELRSLDNIVETLARGKRKLIAKLKEDQEIRETLYVRHDFPRLETLRAKCYHILGWLKWQDKLNAKEAVEYYNLALRITPKEMEFYKWRGIVQFEADKWKLADSDLTTALENSPAMAKDPFLISYAVETKARLGQFNQIDSFLTPLAADSVERLFLEGLVAHYRKEWAKAREKFQAVITKDRVNSRAHFYVGLTHYASGDLAGAVTTFNRIIGFVSMFNIKKDPNRTPRDNLLLAKPLARTYLYRGLAAFKTAEAGGDAAAAAEAKNKARQDCLKALELAPGLPEAKTWLDKLSAE